MAQQAGAHRTLARALDILELCGTREQGYTLSQLSRRLKAPKSSLFPLVHTLHKRGYLTCDQITQCYRIGSMAFHLGNHYLDGETVMGEIQRIMQQVVDACGETCYFGSLKGGDVFYIKEVRPPNPFAMTAAVGRTLPAYATGIGKALLMDYTLPMLRALYCDGLIALTENTVTDFYTLANQLAAMRAEGFAHEEEESTRLVRCVAAPIRKGGQIVAAMSVAMPVPRFTPALAESVRHALDEARSRAERLIQHVDIVF